MYHVPSQRGKRIVVTGANSGTGKEIARRLAGAGAEVIMAVRDASRGENAQRELLAAQPDARLDLRLLDLADLSSVQRFADTLLGEGRPLDVLVNNAGVMVPPKRFETVDGFELQMGTNFLGPFALTLRLLPLLNGPHARVCTMSSTAAIIGRLHFDDLQWRTHYRSAPAYAQSKLAGPRLRLASRRDRPRSRLGAHQQRRSSRLHAHEPQSAGASLGRDRPRRQWVNRAAFLVSQSVVAGAEPMLYAAASPDAFNGAYYGPNGIIVGSTTLARPPRSARSPELGPRLFGLAEEVTGVSLPA